MTTRGAGAAAALILAFAGGGAAALLMARQAHAPAPARAGSTPLAQAPAKPAAGPSAAPVFPPGVSNSPYSGQAAFRLVIPRLGIDAAVESIGTDGHGRIGVPQYIWDAGWYRAGPAPGEPGDAVVDGHLDWYTGPALFAHLADLRPGDAVTIVRAGAQIHFRVTALRWVAYNARPTGLLEPAGPPRLTLITCGGTWDGAAQTYRQRLLVETSLA